MKKIISFLLSLIIIQANITPCLAGNMTYKLNRGTAVKVRITSTISSKSKTTASAIVDADVYDATTNTIVIKGGTPVQLNIDSKKAKGMGKAGYIHVKNMTTTAVDGKTISLSGAMNENGDGKAGLALGLGLGTGLTVLPLVGFFFFLIKGDNVEIPSDTIIPNVVAADNYSIQAE